MKLFKKYKLILLLLFIIFIFGLVCFLADPVLAARLYNPLSITPTKEGLSQFIGKALKYLVVILGSAAFVMLVYGFGLLLLSAGNKEMIGKGRKTVFFALLGLILILGGYPLSNYILCYALSGGACKEPPPPPLTDDCTGTCVKNQGAVTACEDITATPPPAVPASLKLPVITADGYCPATAQLAGLFEEDYLCCKKKPPPDCGKPQSSSRGNALKTFNLDLAEGDIFIDVDFYGIPDSIEVFCGPQTALTATPPPTPPPTAFWEQRLYANAGHFGPIHFTCPDGRVTVRMTASTTARPEDSAWCYAIICDITSYRTNPCLGIGGPPAP